MRRLPIYLLVDTSASMKGEPLEAVRMGMQMLVSRLREYPEAIETVYLSVIAFGDTVQQVVPLTSLADFKEPILEAGGRASMGAGLEELLKCADREVVKTTVHGTGDRKPVVLLMTNGRTTDTWEPAASKVKRKRWGIIACTAGSGADESLLERIANVVVKLNDCSAEGLGGLVLHYMNPPSGPIETESEPLTDTPPHPLPPPPAEVVIVGAEGVPMGNHASHIQKAILSDGREVEYVIDPDRVMVRGGREWYFTVDKSGFVVFEKGGLSQSDHCRHQAIVEKYNPTRDSNSGQYWKRFFEWPTDIVAFPYSGLIMPATPAQFFFQEGPWKGKAKDASWFFGRMAGGRAFRDLLPESERGTWNGLLRASIMLSRAIKGLHSRGLACSSLGPSDFYLDPMSGSIFLTRLDSLVVPGIFPPDYLGTPGYEAPEVLATQHLPVHDADRCQRSPLTDLFSLAVLIYQVLLNRHPLRGPKVNSTKSAEEDDLLSMGVEALFIEHPTDHSNRPDKKQLGVGYEALGPHLVALFNQAFVDGLHDPNRRPIAAQWEDALLKTWDMLHPCPNPACTHQWFVVWQEGRQTCPFCDMRVSG